MSRLTGRPVKLKQHTLRTRSASYLIRQLSQTLVIFNGLVLEPASSGSLSDGDYFLGGSAGGSAVGRLDIKLDADLINQATSDKISIIIPLPSK